MKTKTRPEPVAAVTIPGPPFNSDLKPPTELREVRFCIKCAARSQNGKCHRHPPTASVRGMGYATIADWPPVPDNGWCLDFVSKT